MDGDLGQPSPPESPDSVDPLAEDAGVEDGPYDPFDNLNEQLYFQKLTRAILQLKEETELLRRELHTERKKNKRAVKEKDKLKRYSVKRIKKLIEHADYQLKQKNKFHGREQDFVRKQILYLERRVAAKADVPGPFGSDCLQGLAPSHTKSGSSSRQLKRTSPSSVENAKRQRTSKSPSTSSSSSSSSTVPSDPKQPSTSSSDGSGRFERTEKKPRCPSVPLHNNDFGGLPFMFADELDGYEDNGTDEDIEMMPDPASSEGRSPPDEALPFTFSDQPTRSRSSESIPDSESECLEEEPIASPDSDPVSEGEPLESTHNRETQSGETSSDQLVETDVNIVLHGRFQRGTVPCTIRSCTFEKGQVFHAKSCKSPLQIKNPPVKIRSQNGVVSDLIVDNEKQIRHLSVHFNQNAEFSADDDLRHEDVSMTESFELAQEASATAEGFMPLPTTSRESLNLTHENGSYSCQSDAAEIVELPEQKEQVDASQESIITLDNEDVEDEDVQFIEDVPAVVPNVEGPFFVKTEPDDENIAELERRHNEFFGTGPLSEPVRERAEQLLQSGLEQAWPEQHEDDDAQIDQTITISPRYTLEEKKDLKPYRRAVRLLGCDRDYRSLDDEYWEGMAEKVGYHDELISRVKNLSFVSELTKRSIDGRLESFVIAIQTHYDPNKERASFLHVMSTFCSDSRISVDKARREPFKGVWKKAEPLRITKEFHYVELNVETENATKGDHVCLRVLTGNQEWSNESLFSRPSEFLEIAIDELTGEDVKPIVKEEFKEEVKEEVKEEEMSESTEMKSEPQSPHSSPALDSVEEDSKPCISPKLPCQDQEPSVE